MSLPGHKTKIVCTIGPASSSQETVEAMILAGMNVARINFSHGDFSGHKRIIETVRAASGATGRRVAIMGDLPGPKMRIGDLAEEPVLLTPGSSLALTTERILGTRDRMSVTFRKLPEVVTPGDTLFLNDGFIQVEVLRTEGTETLCRVLVGGEIRSRKGLNLPGIDLGMRSFTERDRECLKFALEAGVDAVSQSFVHSADDIRAVREAAAEFGHNPFVIAKIERSRALEQIDGILAAADAIMIARGDLGVEVPIERIAVVQKMLMGKANLLGKPVITATQMLESMTSNSRPTRAESTDVANAILDGTDCVMLSAESAMGPYPVEAVSMLARIAEAVEPYVEATVVRRQERDLCADTKPVLTDLIAASVVATVDRATPAAVFVPTKSGTTARSIARFRLPVWVIAVSRHESTCQCSQFSYGVFPVHEIAHPEDWRAYTQEWLRSHGIAGDLVVLTEGPSTNHPETNNRMEIIDFRSGTHLSS
ncbi:MAG: pyruvate kinase [Thermodesulfobacteriota bacterium]